MPGEQVDNKKSLVASEKTATHILDLATPLTKAVKEVKDTVSAAKKVFSDARKRAKTAKKAPKTGTIQGKISKTSTKTAKSASVQTSTTKNSIKQTGSSANPSAKTEVKNLHTPRKITVEPLRVPHSRLLSRRPKRADLINAESRLGSQIFGPIPAGHQREFFHDKENIWIWHEEWTDKQGRPRQMTIRYEVREDGVFKKVSAGAYYQLRGKELENFRNAAAVYLKVIKAYLYQV